MTFNEFVNKYIDGRGAYHPAEVVDIARLAWAIALESVKKELTPEGENCNDPK